MTRKGSAQRPWTTDEIDRLRDMAGRLPRRDICRELKRSSGAVKMAAKRLGLSLRCCRTRLVWCDECAGKRDGLCHTFPQRGENEGRATTRVAPTDGGEDGAVR